MTVDSFTEQVVIMDDKTLTLHLHEQKSVKNDSKITKYV